MEWFGARGSWSMDIRQARKVRNTRIVLYFAALTVTTVALLEVLGLL